MKKSSVLLLAVLFAAATSALAVHPNPEVFQRYRGSGAPAKTGASQTPNKPSAGNKASKHDSGSNASKPSGSN